MSHVYVSEERETLLLQQFLLSQGGEGGGRFTAAPNPLHPPPHPPSNPLPCVAPADSGSGDPARHRGSAQDGRHGDAAVLRGRGRLRQHLRTHHQRRGAAVGRDAHLRRYVNQSARFSLTPLTSLSGLSRSSFTLTTTSHTSSVQSNTPLSPPAFSYTLKQEAKTVVSPVSLTA